MSNHRLPENLAELLVLAFEGKIGPEQFELLDRLLAQSPAARQYYFEFVTTYVGLYKSEGVISKAEAGDISISLEESVEASDGSEESVRLYAEQAYAKFKEEERIQQERLAYKAYRARRRRLIVGLSSLAAMVAFLLLAWLTPKSLEESTVMPKPAIHPQLVASILKSVDAQWERSDFSTAAGTRLTASSMQLKLGLMQIVFDKGAEVILQAPCHVRLDDAGRLTLFQGVLSAVVPERAKGFAVQTPTGVVTDYGTEFGVIARENGETETQVYLGKVLLEGNPDLVSSHAPRFLTQGQASAVDRSGRIHSVSFQEHQIVREMPNEPGLGMPGRRLDLADMVGGGNGFGTGTLESGIDPATGSVAYPSINRIRTCQTVYISVPSVPFVDGVFVPDGTKGPVHVSGEDHAFVNCPTTSGLFYSDIAHGGRLLTKGTTEYRALTLDGTVYGTLAHPAIVLHANAGITFDLEAIRSANPGFDFTRFSSMCGISQDTPGEGGARADFWVLVDGKERFRKTAVIPSQGGIPVEVHLDRQDRYLTLMSTDNSHQSDAGINNDYGLFAEPVLE